MKFYIAKGKISYNSDGCIVIYVHPSIVWYYKFWCEKFKGKKLSTSYHKPHISVLIAKHSGDFTRHPLWGKYHGKIVEFKYYSHIFTDDEWFTYGTYYWLKVECPIVAKIRTGLGLKPSLHWPLHCTIGYCCY